MAWYETYSGSERLQLECELLSLDYPQTKVIRCSDNRIRVEGYLGPNNLCSGRYYVVAEYPDNYPYGRIRVWCPYEKFPWGTSHRYTDGDLCLEHDDFTPDDTMATVLGWTLQWLALYENFLRTGEKW